MARDRKPPTSPSDANWERLRRMFQAGAPEFVDALRQNTIAAALAPFAETWWTDPRIEAKRLLFAYLEKPLNAPRHEPLVKRLFKFADTTGDDAVMARFLVGFDRTVRRQRATRERYNYRRRQSEQYEAVVTPARHRSVARRPVVHRGVVPAEPRAVHRGEVPVLGADAPLPPPPGVAVLPPARAHAPGTLPAGRLHRAQALHRRRRARRARAARQLGIGPHSVPPLPCAGGEADRVAAGGEGSLSQLQPEPMFRKLWLRSSEPLFDLLVNAKCRPVSMWALGMLRKHFPERLQQLTLDELLDWIVSPNSALNELAVELLEARGGLEQVTIEQWLRITEGARADLLDRICELVARSVKPEQVSFADAVKLAMQRPVPLARLGSPS
jgi:hypothetical protein